MPCVPIQTHCHILYRYSIFLTLFRATLNSSLIRVFTAAWYEPFVMVLLFPQQILLWFYPVVPSHCCTRR